MRLFWFLSFFFTFSVNASTYGEIAAEHVSSQLSIVTSGLANFHSKSSPVSSKQLRKDIGKLKIYLDVFTFAYKSNLVLEIRQQLDNGYAVIGDFKDLNDTYDNSEVTDELINLKRNKALKWKKAFNRKFVKKEYESYLINPLVSKVEKRNKEDLPKFFWAIVKFPKKEIIDGDSVIRKLLNGMVKVAKKRLEKVVELNNLFSYKRENEYHDFRKLVRAHLKLVDVFFKDEVLADQKLFNINEQLTQLISNFGDLNDLLGRFHHVNSTSKKKKITKLIEAEWKTLKRKLKDKNIGKKLDSFKF